MVLVRSNPSTNLATMLLIYFPARSCTDALFSVRLLEAPASSICMVVFHDNYKSTHSKAIQLTILLKHMQQTGMPESITREFHAQL